jgi:hypothetical protein
MRNQVNIRNFQKNTKFIKDLIDSNFPFINCNSLQKNQTFGNSALQLHLNSRKYFEVLNLLKLTKEFKQLIKTLRFLKDRPKFSIFFFTENDYIAELINNLLVKTSSSTSFEVITDLLQFKRCEKDLSYLKQGNVHLVSPSLLLVLDTPSDSIKKKTFDKILKKNIFLVYKINSIKEKDLFGNYKIFGDLKDVNKILFLISLVNNYT